MKIGSKLAMYLLGLVALAHLIRVINAISVTVGNWNVPLWVSVIGILVPGLIAAKIWSEKS